MTEVPVWIPLVSVLVGAIASGGIQATLAHLDRRRERSATLNAIVSEVAVICELVRFRRYLPLIEEVIEIMETNQEVVIHPVADINGDYFAVFASLSPSLGRLEPAHSRQIVRFYSICKAIVESMNPNGVTRQSQDDVTILRHHRELSQMVHAILRLGDEIVQFAPPAPNLLQSK